jgi:hypothetical protein
VQASREEKVHCPSNTLDTREAKHSPVDARQAKCEYPLWEDERNLEMKEKLETYFADTVCDMQNFSSVQLEYSDSRVECPTVIYMCGN